MMMKGENEISFLKLSENPKYIYIFHNLSTTYICWKIQNSQTRHHLCL